MERNLKAGYIVNQMSQAGLNFLQIPGLTSFPDRVLRGMMRTTIDNGRPEFASPLNVLTPVARPVQAL